MYFFPGYTIGRTETDGLLDAFFRIFAEFNHFYKTRLRVSLEDSRTNFQTRLTIRTWTRINNRELFHLIIPWIIRNFSIT